MSELPSQYWRALIESALDVIIVTEATPLSSPGPRIVYVNPAFTRLTGYEPHEVIGLNPRILQREGSTDPATTSAIRAALEEKKPFDGVIRNFDRHGRAYWLHLHIIPLLDEAGDVAFFAAIERDVTDEQAQLERLAEQASRDTGTGLLNRRALEGAVTEIWDRSLTSDPPHCAIVVDVDDFKGVNDDLGHPTGDAALRAVAAAIRASIRDSDFAVRLGGDEFAVVLPRITAHDAVAMADRIRRRVPRECQAVDDRMTGVTVSVGVASTTPATSGLATVLASADEALYRAKARGKNTVVAATDP